MRGHEGCSSVRKVKHGGDERRSSRENVLTKMKRSWETRVTKVKGR